MFPRLTPAASTPRTAVAGNRRTPETTPPRFRKRGGEPKGGPGSGKATAMPLRETRDRPRSPVITRRRLLRPLKRNRSARRGFSKPAHFHRVLQGGGGLQTISAGRRAGLGSDSYCLLSQGRRYAERVHWLPLRRPAKPAHSSSANASAAEEEKRLIGGLAQRFRRLSDHERRRGSEGLISDPLGEETRNKSRARTSPEAATGLPAGSPGGRLIQLVASPEPEQGSPTSDSASDGDELCRCACKGEMAAAAG